MHYIPRHIETQIEAQLFKGAAIIVYGARRVGKTTLVKQLAEKHGQYLYLNCDEPDVRTELTSKNSLQLKKLVGNTRIVVIDEAQRVENIGLTIKLMVDTLPETQIIATGSSSLDLANKVKEPLTGRSYEIELYPFSVAELSSNRLEAKRLSEHMLVYGGYPAIHELDNRSAAQSLRKLATDYLYRDAFNSNTIYETAIIDNVLKLLAFQIGSEVSYSEIASHLDVSKDTVMRYIALLEHARIVFRLNQYRVNQRVLVGRLRKVYFYDIGIRNGIINNFNPLELRDDTGRLFENMAIVERLKRNQQSRLDVDKYYWRTKTGQEVDYIEATGGDVAGFEFKYRPKKMKPPTQFSKQYPAATWQLVNGENIVDFIT